MSQAFRADVGILLCGEVRDYLASLKVLGHDVTWHEGRGWFSRIFTIAAPEASLLLIKSELRRLAIE